MALLEFELAYYDVAIKYVNHYATGTPLKCKYRSLLRYLNYIHPHPNDKTSYSRSFNQIVSSFFLFSFRITQQLLMLTTVILGCICLKESKVLQYPFYFPESYNIPQILKLTFNINIGRYFFSSFGNILMTKDSKFPAIIIHHFVTLGTYIIISIYQENLFLGICGIFMELSTTPTTITRIFRDTNLHSKNMNGYYLLILAGCDMTFLFRGIVPIICLTFACYTQNPFGMKTFPLVVFSMSVFFFGIINIWLIIQAFYTYSQTLEKKKALSVQPQSTSPSLPSQSSFPTLIQLGLLLNKTIQRDTRKDFLKSTQPNSKKIVFENNLSSKAAQLSEKKVNISLDTPQNNSVAIQPTLQVINEQSNRNTAVSAENIVKFTQFINQ